MSTAKTPAPWRAYVGLGASQGARLETLQAVAAHFATPNESGGKAVHLLASSRVYETRPIGAAVQPFLNAAVELHCELEPAALLDHLLELEQAHGRTRDVRWADRSLDLDILAGVDARGAMHLDLPGLTVPHPRAHERDFALAPLCELAPALQLVGRPVHAWLRALGPQQRTILRPGARLVPGPSRG